VVTESAALVGDVSPQWRTCVGHTLPCLALAASRTYWGLHTLTKLTLRSARLDQLPTAVMLTCAALCELDLSDNGFTTIPTEFRAAPHLQRMNLSRNLILCFDMETLAPLPRLTLLNLTRNPLYHMPCPLPTWPRILVNDCGA